MFNHHILLSLFDTYISSVLCYGCEIWGFHKAPDIEKVHVYLKYQNKYNEYNGLL